MNQSRGVKRLDRFLPRHLPARQPAEFGVNQGQQLLGGVRLTSVDRVQNLRDVIHQLAA